MNDRYGELPEYIADSDRAWLRETVAAATAAAPAHRTSVIWASAERGVPHFAVVCAKCNQIAVGVDRHFLGVQAREHEALG